MIQQYCDIENQCQHFCVYKQMVCPVYIRVSHSITVERDKVLEELFVWVDSEQTITITTDKIIKKILSLCTSPHPNQPSAHKIRRQP